MIEYGQYGLLVEANKKRVPAVISAPCAEVAWINCHRQFAALQGVAEALRANLACDRASRLRTEKAGTKRLSRFGDSNDQKRLGIHIIL